MCNVNASTRGAIVRAFGADPAEYLASGAMFHLTGWTKASDTVAGGGDHSLTISATPSKGVEGTWSVNDFGGHANVLIVIEAGADGWAGFLVDQAAGLSGSWTTAGMGLGSASQLSLWYNG